MRKLIVELPDELHRELKRKAITYQKTLKDVVVDLIHDYLSVSKKQRPVKKKTGICGSWDDDRTADEIIKDIKTHRKWFTRQSN